MWKPTTCARAYNKHCGLEKYLNTCSYIKHVLCDLVIICKNDTIDKTILNWHNQIVFDIGI